MSFSSAATLLWTPRRRSWSVRNDQEFLEFDCPMAGVQLGNDGAVGDVECREPVGHAVAGVVVGLSRAANACDDFARRDHRTSWARSCSVSTNSAFGRPTFVVRPIMLHDRTIRVKTTP